MITDKESKRLSKFLSYLLRHHPESLGLELDENGWTPVDRLIEAMQVNEPGFSREVLHHIVDTNSKKRFALNEDASMIRASQGHSIEGIELGYEEKEPPEILYHGTAGKRVASILAGGLQKMDRHQVHLSTDTDTATMVGQRYGKPVVLVIHAAAMVAAGFSFCRSANGVWLTDVVPAEFIRVL